MGGNHRPSAVCHWGMRCLRPAVRKPVVHCSDERRRQGTHRFHSFEFPGQKHGIPGLHSPGSGGKNDGWSVETRKVTSGNTLPSPCVSKAEVSSAWFPPERGILPPKERHPAPGREKAPLFFPLQRRSGGKPCSSAATPPVLENRGKSNKTQPSPRYPSAPCSLVLHAGSQRTSRRR